MTGKRRITIFTTLSLAVVAALTLAACGGGGGTTTTSAAGPTSAGRSATVSVQSSPLGNILVDAQGRTLYLFAADSGRMSACNGACATAWPPLLQHGNLSVAGGLDPSLVSSIHRADGTRQLTYNGHPLYLFVDDQKAGDVKGQGVTAFGALWYALSPAGNQISKPPSGSGAGGAVPSGTGY